MNKTLMPVFKAEKRIIGSKGSLKVIRKANKVPASIYGDKKDTLAISVSTQDIIKNYRKDGFYTKMLEIDVEGKTEQVLARLVQLHPVTDKPLHVDFLRIGPKSKIRINVPFHFINQEKSTGIKFGGILNIVHHEIEVSCLANAIPEFIEVDIGGTEIGDAVKLDSIKLAKGVTPVKSDNITIATIVPPQAEETNKPGAETAAATSTPAADAKPAAK